MSAKLVDLVEGLEAKHKRCAALAALREKLKWLTAIGRVEFEPNTQREQDAKQKKKAKEPEVHHSPLFFLPQI